MRYEVADLSLDSSNRPCIPNDKGTVHIFQHQRVLLASNVPVAHEIAKSAVTHSSAVLGKVKDDVFSHVEESVSGDLGTALKDAVENIVVEGNVADWSLLEVGNEKPFELVELLYGRGIAENRVADCYV